MVRRHDLDHQFAAGRVGEHVPKVKCAALGIFGDINFFRAEQGVDGLVGKAVSPFLTQILHRPAQNALDTAAGQIREAVGCQESKAVFNGVFIAQAGGKGRCGLGADAVGVCAVVGVQSVLAGAQGFNLLEGCCREAVTHFVEYTVKLLLLLGIGIATRLARWRVADDFGLAFVRGKGRAIVTLCVAQVAQKFMARCSFFEAVFAAGVDVGRHCGYALG